MDFIQNQKSCLFYTKVNQTLYTQIQTWLVDQPHLLLILLKHAKKPGKEKFPS